MFDDLLLTLPFNPNVGNSGERILNVSPVSICHLDDNMNVSGKL